MSPAEPLTTNRSIIVTLTMNPALDITTETTAVGPTHKVRCGPARYDAGGGGVNVAKIAHSLGASVSAVLPVGGATGHVLTDLLATAGVRFHAIAIDEPTRESFTINESSTGLQYRFVLPGARLTIPEQERCLDTLRWVARPAGFVVASGSLPPGVPTDFYQRIAEICADLGVLFVLDTSGSGLRHIRSGVFLLKASVRELRECVGRELADESEQLAAARELIDRGCAQAVVVSLGSQGALLAMPHGSQRFRAVPMASGSGVGAGDAMVAAITTGLSRGWPLARCVRLGIAAGAAMLMTPGTAACDRTDVTKIFETVAEPTDVAVVRS